MKKEAIFIQKSIRVIFTAVYLIIFVSSILPLSKTGQSASARILLSPFPTQIRTEPPPPTSTPSPSPCTSWNLASDFRISPNQENPNRDSCNNLGIWEFMGSPGLDRVPAAYYPMSTFTASGGLNMWQGNNGEGHISFNASGVDYIQGAITWPANTIDVHPGPAQMVVMAWHSPVNGHISVTGSVSDNNPYTGNCNNQDGILWFIDKNSTNIALGGFVNGGSQTFASGTNGANLNTVSVISGDVIYLAIHPGGNYYCDDTFVDLAINVTSAINVTIAPTSMPAATSTPINGYNYNRVAAVAYANQWAHEPRNSVFGGVLPPGTNYTGCNCDNCTNFMSQVLLAGGYPFHGNSPNDWVENWWYTSTNSSLSWRYVPSFENYFEVHPNEFYTVSQASILQAGDIIMLDLHGVNLDDPPDGTYDHIKVVVGVGYTSSNPIDYTYCENGVLVIPTNIPAGTNTVLINQNCIDRWHVAWDYGVDEEAITIFIHVID